MFYSYFIQQLEKDRLTWLLGPLRRWTNASVRERVGGESLPAIPSDFPRPHYFYPISVPLNVFLDPLLSSPLLASIFKYRYRARSSSIFPVHKDEYWHLQQIVFRPKSLSITYVANAYHFACSIKPSPPHVHTHLFNQKPSEYPNTHVYLSSMHIHQLPHVDGKEIIPERGVGIAWLRFWLTIFPACQGCRQVL